MMNNVTNCNEVHLAVGIKLGGRDNARPVARGGVGGVPAPHSGINDIHNFNYLIKKGHLIVFSLASEPQIAPEPLSWHENLKSFMQLAPDPLNIYVPPFHRFLDLHACMPLHVRTHDLQR